MATIIITGASGDFGRLTAIKCAQNGHQVIATMRHPEKAVRFDQELSMEERLRVDVWQLDVTDSDSIAAFQKKLRKLSCVDVLINNAGIAVGGFSEYVPIELYRKQFEVNVFGAIQITQSVLPIMRKRGNGKIINVSSISGRIGFPGISAYAASKFALEGWSESLRHEVAPFGIDVLILEPGSYETNIWSENMIIDEHIHSTESAYYQFGQKIWYHVKRGKKRNPEEVANRLVHHIEQPRLKSLRDPVHFVNRLTIMAKQLMPWRLFEWLVKRSLK